MFNVNDIFDEVRTAVMSQDNSDGIWKEKLKFEAGKEYVLRLIPYIKEGRDGLKKSLVNYVKYTWQDPTGKWRSVLSPRTWGGKCPIGDYSYRIKFKGSEAEKEDMDKRLTYRAGAYANVYVIKDPTNPENEGKVKILDMGKKINTLIKSALDGAFDKAWTDQARRYSMDKSIEIKVGPKVYDLSPDGVNLIIRVNKNQYGLNDYSASEFSIADTDLGKSQEEIQALYEACHDLSKIDPILDFDEITKLFKETYLNVEEPIVELPQSNKNISANSQPEDAIPTYTPAATVVHPSVANPGAEVPVDDWFKQNGFDTSKLS